MASQPTQEIVHIALGDAACHVSTHWLNLQGLAATGSDALCDASITHSIHHEASFYGPRALLVGDADPPRPIAPVGQDLMQPLESALFLPTYTGPVESVPLQSSLSLSWNPPTPATTLTQFAPPHASSLAYSAYSRYKVPARPSRDPSLASQGRHVNWDDEGEEEEEDDGAEGDRHEQQRQHEWQSQYRPAQDALDLFWNTTSIEESLGNEQAIPSEPSLPKSVPLQRRKHDAWRTFLMPPYSPSMVLQYEDVRNTDHASYHSSSTFDVEVLWERVRRMLEDCDSVQGLTLMQSNDGRSHRSGTALLREWHDECPNTSRWIIDLVNHVDEDETEDDTKGKDKELSTLDSKTTTATEAHHQNNEAPSPHQPGTSSQRFALLRQQRMVRRDVERALIMSDQTDLASVYLPLMLPSSDVLGAATVALALECSSLPYRLATHGSARSKVGLQSFYNGNYCGSDAFGSASSLSFREYMRSLQRQSGSRNIIELDTLAPSHALTSSHTTLFAKLQTGTSLERDRRMRQSGYHGGVHRPRDEAPGAWMAGGKSNTVTSLSPSASYSQTNPDYGNRHLHRHFALSSALRPTSIEDSSSVVQATTSNYVTCLMEGMGIGYRPEQTVATVVDQSLSRLVRDGYGAGSYWPSVFPATNATRSWPSQSVLAVTGNTTRIYPFLFDTAQTAQAVLSPRRRTTLRSLYQRHVAEGRLPELDDCKESLSACLDLRDSYEPPEGSGLAMESEGSSLW